MKLIRLQNSNLLLFSGLIMLAAGLPVSLFLTSLAQFFIAGSLFLEGSVTEKLRRFSRNRIAVFISILWILHLIGLLWTSDMNEGMKDLRIKLPLLILPVVLGGSAPLSRKQFYWVCGIFVASVFTGTMVSMAVYAGIIERNIQSIREIFIFNISHIRFSLFVCLSVFILIHSATRAFRRRIYGVLLINVLLIAWFVYFLVFMESMTGMLILLATSIIHLIIAGIRAKGIRTRVITLSAAIIIPLVLFIETNGILNEYKQKQEFPIDVTEKTSQGNPYTFAKDQILYENGFPIWAYVCETELRPAWNSVSSIPYDSLDERGQSIKYTLIRFLTSKGLRKDKDGINSLSAGEIKSIERGIANVKYQNLSNARIRLIQIIWEFDQYRLGENPSGHSVTQRFEFWKAACGIISAQPISGVGTGDMPQAYRDEYVKMDSQLSEKFRLRAHNQYLAIAVALGIPALIYFIFVLIFSLLSKGSWKDFLFRSFWIIAVLSMLTEDTLETQSGVTFFVFFLCLFLFLRGESAIIMKEGELRN